MRNFNYTRNYHFNTIEEANKKWELVLANRAYFSAYHYAYVHIRGLPDYVVSITCDIDEVDIVEGLLNE